MVTIEEAQRDKELMNTFIEENIGLVRAVIKRNFRTHANTENYDEYYQAGLIGMYKAALKYDPKFGTEFSTLAVPTIDGEIRKYRRDKEDNLMAIPRSVKVMYFKIRSLHNQELSEQDICDKLKISGVRYNYCVNAMKLKSIQESYGECDGNKDMTLEDRLYSDFNIEENVIAKDMWEKISKVIKDSDMKIIQMRANGKSQQYISQVTGVSQVQVSRRMKKIKELYEVMNKRCV